MLSYNIALPNKVEKDAMKTDKPSEVAELADYSERTIRMIGIMAFISILESTLPHVRFCTETYVRTLSYIMPELISCFVFSQ